MNRSFHRFAFATLGSAAVLALASTLAGAQTLGFVSSGNAIQSFDPSTGLIVNTFTGGISVPAVSPDGSTLYSPIQFDSGNYLLLLSASSGDLLKAIPGLGVNPKKVILSPSGSYAYVMGTNGEYYNALVSVVDLTAQKVVAYIEVAGGIPWDIAVSPDGTKLYVANGSPSGAVAQAKPLNGVASTCPTGHNICVFNTSTYALIGQVKGVYGWLAVSQDGNTLYTWLQSPYYVAVNTSTLALSAIGLPSGYYPQAMAVAPSGNEAVLSTASTTSTAFFILDTTSNKITGTFPAPAASLRSLGSNAVAFSLDGGSLWTLGGCAQDVCSALYGQSFPSGNVIAQTALEGLGPNGIVF